MVERVRWLNTTIFRCFFLSFKWWSDWLPCCLVFRPFYRKRSSIMWTSKYLVLDVSRFWVPSNQIPNVFRHPWMLNQRRNWSLSKIHQNGGIVGSQNYSYIVKAKQILSVFGQVFNEDKPWPTMNQVMQFLTLSLPCISGVLKNGPCTFSTFKAFNLTYLHMLCS